MSFSQSLLSSSAASPVFILFGEHEASLVYAEYAGRTVAQLFELFGDRLGTDVSTIESYTLNGDSIESSALVEAGMHIRGVKKSDGKGA